jgi:hypothetical protein
MAQTLDLSVAQGDITEIAADVIALKYARSFHGADKYVASLLNDAGIPLSTLQPDQGNYVYVPSRGTVPAGHVLFVGVPYLRDFRYPQIHDFASDVLRITQKEKPSATHVAVTIHGPGYGLDETEAFLSLVQGILDGLRRNEVPQHLARITVVDRSPGRVQRLRQALGTSLEHAEYASPLPDGGVHLDVHLAPSTATGVPAASIGAGAAAQPKPHVFVAMPFSMHLDDVFYYGIQTPVHNAGYLCERIDHSAFTGNIVETVKEIIETAAIVVAEISDGNPNVFLEVGYAWGNRRPTILLATSLDDLPFDVRGHKCLKYQGIRDLEESLTRELAELSARNFI